MRGMNLLKPGLSASMVKTRESRKRLGNLPSQKFDVLARRSCPVWSNAWSPVGNGTFRTRVLIGLDDETPIGGRRNARTD